MDPFIIIGPILFIGLVIIVVKYFVDMDKTPRTGFSKRFSEEEFERWKRQNQEEREKNKDK